MRVVGVAFQGMRKENKMSDAVVGDEDDSAISEEEMRRLRKLADARPELILFIVEELIALLEERGLLGEGALREIISGALFNWQEAGKPT